MAAGFQAEITISSAKDLKNINWRHGHLKPYVVAWIDPSAKCSTSVARGGDDDDPIWDEKLSIPLPPGLPLEDATLYLDVVHAGAAEGVKPLIGSTRLRLRKVVDKAGIGGKFSKKKKLKRPSGRPQGKIEVSVVIKESVCQYDPYGAPPPYGYAQPYGGAPYAQPPTGYPYGAPPGGEYGYHEHEGRGESKMGMGAGLAVGVAAGVLGGLAIAEGVEILEEAEDDQGDDD